MDAAAVVEVKPAGSLERSVEPKAPHLDSPVVKEDAPVNRETKLALLIGFVAVVVVTVLVGEHFGKGRNAAPATTGLGTSAAADPSATGLVVDPITATPVGTPANPVVIPTVGGQAPAPTAMPGEPGLANGTGTPAPVTPVNPDRFLPPAAAGLSTGLGGEQVPETAPVGPGMNTPNSFNPVPTAIDPMIMPPARPEPASNKPASAGVEKLHPVQRGETLSAIATRHYGTRELSDELAAYNKKLLGANGVLRAGVTLRIPPRDVLTGKATLAAGNAGRTTSASVPTNKAAPKAEPKAKPVGPRTYTVKKGDSLMTIAKRELGSAGRWEAIKVANPGLDEDALRTGMVIKLPAK